MDSFTIILAILNILLLLVVLFFIIKGQKRPNDDGQRDFLLGQLKENRQELSVLLKENRVELSDSIDVLAKKLEEALKEMAESVTKGEKENRESLANALTKFSESFKKDVTSFNEMQRYQFEQMGKKQDELVTTTELKLEKMRETVDEKLNKTLEDRLGRSFKLVSDRLEAVQKGLGEMQQLASGVGDLKKVLSNVKTRGVLGEIQLGGLLEQIMAPEQYATNVKTKRGSANIVEYAIKLPGKREIEDQVWLPIDAKFPQEDYIRLQDAYETGDKVLIDKATNALKHAVKTFAKDITQKYIDPPNTTDFGIMFLPMEGLYAEVARHPELLITLQRDYKIILAGPTTLAAMLNSLQMGFKTLAIQKRSSEVWTILGSVKTEFSRFGAVLEKAQKKITEANKDIDDLVGTRTRMMLSKLKKVEEIPTSDVDELLLPDNKQ